MRTRDVIVAGAGPGGSTTAAFLADAGLDVLLLEKQAFPRFVIGESLLPACVPVIRRLGIDPSPDTFVHKGGAAFVDERAGTAERFPFSEAMDGCPDHAWHVERPLFDLRLRDRAIRAGVEVRHQVTVQAVEPGPDEVRVTTTAGVERTRFLVDATGQGRLLARRMSSARHFEEFGMSAAYTHYEGVGAAYEEVFGEANDVRILLRDDGWGWIIPLPARRLSIGLVSKSKVGPEDLEQGLLAGPLARRLTAGARRLETHVVGNYSFENTVPYGRRFATVGDACAFLDPVFSSGVTLALRGAESLAHVLTAALAAGREAAPDLLEPHRSTMDRAYRTFFCLISRFYHGTFAASFFLRSLPDYEMRRGVVSVLAGDVWRSDNPFQEMLLRGRHMTSAAGKPA